MKEYLLLLRGGKTSNYSEEQRNKSYAKWGEYMDKYANKGKLVGGLPLETSGKILTENGIEDAVPKTTTGETVDGWLQFKVDTEEEIYAIAKECPIFDDHGNIEIREVSQMP